MPAVKDAKARFEELVRRTRREGLPLAPADGVAYMQAFYDEVRFDGLVDEPCADVLLYQYGTYDFGDGEEFIYDIARQLVVPDGDGREVWQLSLRFIFAPTEALRALGDGERWCNEHGESASLGTFIEGCPARAAVAAVTPMKVSLRFEQAE